jgi:hypothetical protein
MLEPKEVVVDGKVYVISKFPAVAGRKIMTQYPISAIPKVGEYGTNEEMMYLIMTYVAVKNVGSNTELQLVNRDLIDNHVPNWETLMKLEYLMMEYNCSFLANGKVSTFLESIAEKLPSWITKISTPLSEALSQAEKPRSKNSKKATP